MQLMKLLKSPTLAARVDRFGQHGGADDAKASDDDDPVRRDFAEEEDLDCKRDQNGDIEHQERDEAVDTPEGLVIEKLADPGEDTDSQCVQ